MLLILFGVLGALDSALGIAAVVIVGAAMLGDLILVRRCRAAGPAIELALGRGLGSNFEHEVDPELAPSDQRPVSIAHESFGPFRARRRDVVHVADIPYGGGGVRNHLDLYVHRSRPQNCPVLIYLHGGAWTHGKKDRQGLPIVYLFASRGWLCIQPNYRLCPDATFPDPLVDIKRAIAWVHQHAHEHGGDPRQIFITGGSAGGHLSALAALTMNDPRSNRVSKTPTRRSSPRCPCTATTTGSTLTASEPTRGLDRSKYFTDKIVKCSPDADAQRWEQGSPLYHVRPDAPPFFVVHGSSDSMLLVEDARHFVDGAGVGVPVARCLRRTSRGAACLRRVRSR